MSKQEETRKDIDKVLIAATGRTGEDLDKVKRVLSELGVVVKVERELPHPWRDDCMSAHSETCKTCDNCEILEWAQFDLIESGYVATVPLIEKV